MPRCKLYHLFLYLHIVTSYEGAFSYLLHASIDVHPPTYVCSEASRMSTGLVTPIEADPDVRGPKSPNKVDSYLFLNFGDVRDIIQV